MGIGIDQNYFCLMDVRVASVKLMALRPRRELAMVRSMLRMKCRSDSAEKLNTRPVQVQILLSCGCVAHVALEAPLQKKINGNKHSMDSERGKRYALTTAQRYNYSCLMDARVASAKLKARWPRRELAVVVRSMLRMKGSSTSAEKVTKQGPNTSLWASNELKLDFPPFFSI